VNLRLGLKLLKKGAILLVPFGGIYLLWKRYGADGAEAVGAFDPTAKTPDGTPFVFIASDVTDPYYYCKGKVGCEPDPTKPFVPGGQWGYVIPQTSDPGAYGFPTSTPRAEHRRLDGAHARQWAHVRVRRLHADPGGGLRDGTQAPPEGKPRPVGARRLMKLAYRKILAAVALLGTAVTFVRVFRMHDRVSGAPRTPPTIREQDWSVWLGTIPYDICGGRGDTPAARAARCVPAVRAGDWAMGSKTSRPQLKDGREKSGIGDKAMKLEDWARNMRERGKSIVVEPCTECATVNWDYPLFSAVDAGEAGKVVRFLNDENAMENERAFLLEPRRT
jgi:hypothetical protein